MKTEGVKVEIREGAKLIAECSKCSLSMVDGKMINTLLHLARGCLKYYVCKESIRV